MEKFNNIDITGKDCCGCGACYTNCPTNAISMQEDSEGFLYPVIDKNKCTNCGLCVKICPVVNPKYGNSSNPKCYAAMANDEIRCHSSSGGIFPVLACYFLKNNGYVAGAVWDKDGSVKHIVSNKQEDIEAMRSSKYIQSSIGNCYKEIKDLLKDNKRVLFTGTPCQIAGLYGYLRKEYENLYTVEIICHGVPSPKVFKKYLDEELNENEKFLYTNFRDKINGWNPYLTITTTTTTRKFSYKAKQDNFMQAFLKNLCLRNSCGACRFNKLPRQADITIGDFWKIDKYKKKFNDQKGTSLILINNLKGDFLLKNVENELKLIKKVPIKYAIKGNSNIIKSTKINDKRKFFFENLEVKSLKELVYKYTINDPEYLIVNFWDTSNNYGACLTAFAMQELINSFGFKVLLLDTGEKTEQVGYLNSFAKHFAEKYLNVIKLSRFKQLKKYTCSLKGVILGSDQVLRLEYINKNINKYLLSFVDKKCKKIAISPSFGINKKEFIADKFSTKKNIKILKKALQSYDYLSCREISGKEIFKDIMHMDADMILDPVFLINKNQYDILIKDSTKDFSGKIVNYILDKNVYQNNIFQSFVKKLNSEIFYLDRTTGEVSVSDWLNAIKNCKFFITDSFHGACFAIIFNKPFICIKNKKRGSARFDSLVELLDIKDNFVTSLEEAKDINLEMDWTRINFKLESERKRCLGVLEKVFFENYSNNIKTFSKIKRTSIIKKLGYNLKIIMYAVSKIFNNQKKEIYNQKISKIKHFIEWGG